MYISLLLPVTVPLAFDNLCNLLSVTDGACAQVLETLKQYFHRRLLETYDCQSD